MQNEFPNLKECRNFKYFNAESFLNDLYTLHWIEIDNKENVDKMWECWKSLCVQVLDKQAPLKTKRVRKRVMFLGLIGMSEQSYLKEIF